MDAIVSQAHAQRVALAPHARSEPLVSSSSSSFLQRLVATAVGGLLAANGVVLTTGLGLGGVSAAPAPSPFPSGPVAAPAVVAATITDATGATITVDPTTAA